MFIQNLLYLVNDTNLPYRLTKCYPSLISKTYIDKSNIINHKLEIGTSIFEKISSIEYG